jgi:hypothetical protein
MKWLEDPSQETERSRLLGGRGQARVEGSRRSQHTPFGLVPVREHRLPRYARHPHDLRYRQLMLREQSHHQQPLPGHIRLGLR